MFDRILAGIHFRLAAASARARLRKVRAISNVSIHPDFSMGDGSEFMLQGTPARLSVGRGVTAMKGCNFLVHEAGTLLVGDHVFFNNYCSVNCLGHIEIGEHTIFGEGVRIYDHNHDYHRNADNVLIVEKNKWNISGVLIGKNCWIASNVVILKGVSIGDNSIIGANCLIHKSVPPHSIVKSGSTLIVQPATTAP